MAETPTIEVAPVWICRGGCGLRVRNADGRPIPEPAKWEGGLCIPCRVDAERLANGQKAANELHDRLMGIRKRTGPFGHHDPGFNSPPPEKPPEKKPRRRSTEDGLTPEQRDQIDAE